MKKILTILFILSSSLIYSQATLTDLNLVFDIIASNNITSSTFEVQGAVFHSTTEYSGSDVQVGDLVYFQDGPTTYSLPIQSITSQTYSYVTLVLADESSTVEYVPTGRAAIVSVSDPNLLPVPPDGIPADLAAGILNDLRLKIQIGVNNAEEITDYTGALDVPPAYSPSSHTGETWRNSIGQLFYSDGTNWVTDKEVLLTNTSLLNQASGRYKIGVDTSGIKDIIYISNNNVFKKLEVGGTLIGEVITVSDTTVLDTVNRVQFYQYPILAGGERILTWNDTDGTLEFGMKGGNVTQQIGQELPVLVKHADNAGLENGKVVYIAGSDGSNKTVRYAQSNVEATSAGTFGVMTESSTGGSKAFCTTFGLVRNINTSNLTAGKVVWLSADTAGAMTAVRPIAPKHGVMVGFCIRKHATQGIIFVEVQNGYELNELHDVHTPNPTDNQVLTWNSANSRWEAETLPDISSTNEIQTLSVASNKVSLSSGGSVTFKGEGINAVSTVGDTIKITGTEIDGSTTNELQTISVASNTVTLSNSGGSVTIAGGGINTVGTSGTTITVTGTEVDGSTTNELQTLSTNSTPGNITLSSGNTITLNVNDADASTTNEIQQVDTFRVNSTNLELSLTSDGQSVRTVPLSSIVTGGGGITGTLATGQVAFGSATNTITGDNNFTYNTSSQTLYAGADPASEVANAGLVVTSNNGLAGIYRFSNDNLQPGIFFAKSRGTITTPANVQSGDLIGNFGFIPRFNGWVSDRAFFGGQITGTPNATDIPVSIYFKVGATVSPYNSAFYVHHSQKVRIGANSMLATLPEPAAKLDVIGLGATASTWTAQFHNSNGNNNALMVRDDGFVGINTSTSQGAVGVTPFEVNGRGRFYQGVEFGSSAVARISNTGDYYKSASGSDGFGFYNNLNLNPTTGTYGWAIFETGINPTSGNATISTIALRPTINITGTATTAAVGIDYNPTITSIGSGFHYAALFRSGNVGIGTSSPSSTLDVLGNVEFQNPTTAFDGGVIGSELLTTGTGAGWTGTSLPVGYTHTDTTNATALVSGFTPANATIYQVIYSVSGRTKGSITFSFGGFTSAAISTNVTDVNVSQATTSTGPLTITPTANFDGTVKFSIKAITTSSAEFVGRNQAGTIVYEERYTTSNTNLYIGVETGRLNTTGLNNVGLGISALTRNTTGSTNVAIGPLTLSSNTTGGSNIAIGRASLANNTTGNSNVALGSSSMELNTTGISNFALGVQALNRNTTGNSNVAIGVQAMFFNTSGSNNIAIGIGSLLNNLTAGSSVSIGSNAMRENINASQNTAIGANALRYNMRGANNVAIGSNAGANIGTLSVTDTLMTNSVLIGADSRNLGTGQSNQIVIGYQGRGLGSNKTRIGNSLTEQTHLDGELTIGNTFYDNRVAARIVGANVVSTEYSLVVTNSNGATSTNTNGSLVVTNDGKVGVGTYSPTDPLTVSGRINQINLGGSIFIGENSGRVEDLSSNRNTFIGFETGFNTTTGDNNIFIGYTTGKGNTTGYQNIFEGNGAGFTNTTGHNNIFQGQSSGRLNTIGQYNIFQGTDAGYSNVDGNYNIFQGAQAGRSNTSGGNNIYQGYQAGYSSTTGSENLFQGFQAGFFNTTGSTNIFQGYRAGYSNTTGSANFVQGNNAGYNLTTGNNNLFQGASAGRNTTTGIRNNFQGIGSAFSNVRGSNNIAIGYEAARYIGTGTTGNTRLDSSIFIGYQTRALDTAQINQIVIGYNVVGLGSNTTRIGNSNTTQTHLDGKLSLGSTATPVRTLNVTGEVRITDLSTDTPTKLVGADADGDLDDVFLGESLVLSGGVLDITSAAAVNASEVIIESSTATTIDLDVSGNVKTIDGGNATFVYPTNLSRLAVYKNGVRLTRSGTPTPARDFSVNTTTNEITFTTALVSTDRIVIVKL